jgi:hypothetical protein
MKKFVSIVGQEGIASILRDPNSRVRFLNDLFREYNDTENPVNLYTVFINKNLAEILLKFNMTLHPGLENRDLNKKVVSYLAGQIIKGTMRNTGEALIFTSQGDGIDLQHRLNAVVAAWAQMTKTVTDPQEVARLAQEIGYTSTIIVGLKVESIEALIENLLVMGQTKRTKKDILKFVQTTSKATLTHWEMVEYFMFPEGLRPGTLQTAFSKADINREYMSQKEFYDETLAYINGLFGDPKDKTDEQFTINKPLGPKRVGIYAASYLKMAVVDEAKAREFMQAFFNPLDNTLRKGNAVDALRYELVEGFETQFRDEHRPIIVRDALMKGFLHFIAGEIRTRWTRADFGLPPLKVRDGVLGEQRRPVASVAA